MKENKTLEMMRQKASQIEKNNMLVIDYENKLATERRKINIKRMKIPINSENNLFFKKNRKSLNLNLTIRDIDVKKKISQIDKIKIPIKSTLKFIENNSLFVKPSFNQKIITKTLQDYDLLNELNYHIKDNAANIRACLADQNIFKIKTILNDISVKRKRQCPINQVCVNPSQGLNLTLTDHPISSNFFGKENLLKMLKLHEFNLKTIRNKEITPILNTTNINRAYDLKFIGDIAKFNREKRHILGTPKKDFPLLIFSNTIASLYHEDPKNLRLNLSDYARNHSKLENRSFNERKFNSSIENIELGFIDKNVRENKNKNHHTTMSLGSKRKQQDMIKSNRIIYLNPTKSWLNDIDLKTDRVYALKDCFSDGVDLILNEYTCCLAYTSSNFEDEYENVKFENLTNTINKIYLQWDIIIVLIFQDKIGTSNKCLKNVERLIKTNFNLLSNFVKIQILLLNTYNVPQELMASDKESCMERTIKINEAPMDRELILFIKNLRSNFPFFNIIHIYNIISYILDDNEAELISYLSDLIKNYSKKNIHFTTEQIFNLL